MSSILFRTGRRGPVVKDIQRRLKSLHYYQADLDGIFGGATESAVMRFQKTEGLPVDGKVGPQTWKSLFPEIPFPMSMIGDVPLFQRCLELTGTMETGFLPPKCYAKLSGDFDDQGLSFGVLQWNIGQESLPVMFKKIDEAYPELLDEVFHRDAGKIRSVFRNSESKQLEWARFIQTQASHRVVQPWAGRFIALGLRGETQEVQREMARGIYDSAMHHCRKLGLRTERGLALMFDVLTQCSVTGEKLAIVRQEFAALPEGQTQETVKMAIIANVFADHARAKWREDVRMRKMTIAKGKGYVHGEYFDLEHFYGIRLVNVPELKLAAEPV